MTLGRGSSAGTVADLARTGPSDRVVDVGCGSGTAARLASRRGSTATGIDPSPWKLRTARAISSVRRTPRVTFLAGSAESLPLPDASATVVWSMSSVHHWGDRVRGLAEARRVLAPGGRLLLAERRVKQGARGLGAHGLTAEQEAQLLLEVEEAGFQNVKVESHGSGGKAFVVVLGNVPAPLAQGAG
ncbi:MAG: class I SAM-dependent methyltransferase [Acidimicrobiales bacterium]